MSSSQDTCQLNVLGEKTPPHPEQGDKCEVDCLCGRSHLLRRLETCKSPVPHREEMTHLGGPPGLMPTLWCPAGGCLIYPEVGPVYTQNFNKGFGLSKILGDDSLSTHDPFLRKTHFKIRKGN